MKLSKAQKQKIENSRDFLHFKEVIFPQVMKWEGGSKLHKVSGDGGGWTKYGIAYNFWKHLFNDFEDFKDTTLDEAIYFAYEKFYAVIRADLVPYDAKLYYFDMAYNMGTSRAIRIMQRCVGLKEDGVIGPMTRLYMQRVKESCLKAERDRYYKSLVGRFSRLSKFYKGWINRSNSIFKHFY